MSTALFGDGAAAALMSGRPSGVEPRGARILTTRSHLFPDSLEALGFELRDDGFHVLLAKDLPERLGGELAGVVDGMLAEVGPAPADLTSFVLHPGGRKILAALQAGACTSNRPRCSRPGTCCASTATCPAPRCCSCWIAGCAGTGPRRKLSACWAAFGPGLTAELCVLQWN